MAAPDDPTTSRGPAVAGALPDPLAALTELVGRLGRLAADTPTPFPVPAPAAGPDLRPMMDLLAGQAALPAAQLESAVAELRARREQISALRTQLDAFDAQLEALEKTLQPLVAWAAAWDGVRRAALGAPAAGRPSPGTDGRSS